MLDQVQFGGFIDAPTEQEYDDVVYKRGNDDKPKRADERKDDILAKIKVCAQERVDACSRIHSTYGPLAQQRL